MSVQQLHAQRSSLGVTRLTKSIDVFHRKVIRIQSPTTILWRRLDRHRCGNELANFDIGKMNQLQQIRNRRRHSRKFKLAQLQTKLTDRGAIVSQQSLHVFKVQKLMRNLGTGIHGPIGFGKTNFRMMMADVLDRKP